MIDHKVNIIIFVQNVQQQFQVLMLIKIIAHIILTMFLIRQELLLKVMILVYIFNYTVYLHIYSFIYILFN